jgi:membrane protein
VTGLRSRLLQAIGAVVVLCVALSLGLGLVGTIFSATAVYGALDSSLAAVLGRAQGRTLIRGRLEAAGFLAILAVLPVLSIGFSYGVGLAAEGLVNVGFGGAVRVALRILAPLVGLATGFVFFYLVYRVVPRRRVPRRAAAGAALVSAVLWEVAKLAFGFFTRALGVFAAYGPLALAAGLLTWIYVTAVIILVGAEVVKTRGAP